MSDQLKRWFRLALLTELIERAPCKLGRTAIMKLTFLLQAVKGVPLGYDFRLYTYGPFESDVLNDLGQAETLQAVQSQMVSYSSGYGYEFTAGPQSHEIKARAASDLAKYEGDIGWALEEFATKSASDLELLSTIVYADRDTLRRHQRLSVQELCRLVKEIKPRFSDEYILQNISTMSDKRTLLATDLPSPS
jgi:uncharacterized protein